MTNFNVGVNEEQSLADKLGQKYPQNVINYTSAKRLAEYYQKVNNHDWNGKQSAGDMLKLLELCPVDPLTKKDVRIHEYSQRIVRELYGVRFEQCKSAKDRTSMGVSLEQARILRDGYCLPDEIFEESLDKIRRDGLGLVRCYKNIGKHCYAFNPLQLSTFPRIMKPPNGTYGSAMS